MRTTSIQATAAWTHPKTLISKYCPSRYDYRKALNLAKALTVQYPKDYYAHEYFRNIYQEMGDLDHAEEEYSRAYELSPPQVLQEKLRSVRQRRRREQSTQPSPEATR